ncbi:probable cytosine-specific DNA methyltransferase [Crocosphaera subtropica ATCC 51142]|uniref:site-specific DNA-methyltransferase (adenine-specific) n=1 Tax=Crocosphaera subtropica (strain ATCC 51142 / BH68) TaxID=43989 RepID=B1WTU6_CROS5|nr:DNA adenine methylase [Crocosphaera subtropica]ACB50412.1 probable cytosine-specific DNA methyltransferase [Crocosphaera subtropica ATCC 51142]
MIKSPLRYPGGKSRAVKQIQEQLPNNFSEYREPFVGGGSVFIYLKQIYPNIDIWINDLNPELYLFWKVAQSDLKTLVTELRNIKKNRKNGRELFTELSQVDVEKISNFDRAVRFFVLNRITFSGTIESGGYSERSFNSRFTESSIARVEKLGHILPEIRITNLDYREVINNKCENTFIFLDPPYLTATKSKLYGKDGDLHTLFNHQDFAETMKECQHKWLITYDDAQEIRNYFQDFNIIPWQLQYGMNNYKQGKAKKGQEIFIRNYQTEKTVIKSQQLSLNLNIC